MAYATSPGCIGALGMTGVQWFLLIMLAIVFVGGGIMSYLEYRGKAYED